jgi:hypothetical protein
MPVTWLQAAGVHLHRHQDSRYGVKADSSQHTLHLSCRSSNTANSFAAVEPVSWPPNHQMRVSYPTSRCTMQKH